MSVTTCEMIFGQSFRIVKFVAILKSEIICDFDFQGHCFQFLEIFSIFRKTLVLILSQKRHYVY